MLNREIPRPASLIPSLKICAIANISYAAERCFAQLGTDWPIPEGGVLLKGFQLINKDDTISRSRRVLRQYCNIPHRTGHISYLLSCPLSTMSAGSVLATPIANEAHVGLRQCIKLNLNLSLSPFRIWRHT